MLISIFTGYGYLVINVIIYESVIFGNILKYPVNTIVGTLVRLINFA